MKRNPIVTAAMVAVCSILSAQAGTKKATICTTYGDDIYDYELDQMIDSVVPPSAKRLIVLTQCYGGDCLDNFTGTNTAVISATSPGQKAIYGGYDDDAANACKPGAGRTGQAVHDAGSAGKDSTETPSTGGGLAPGAVSLEPVTADGAVRSRHVIVYAGMPDAKGRDNAQRDKIKANFAGQPNTTVRTVGGDGPKSGWDKHGWKRGLQAAIDEAAAAIEAAPDPSKEQFLLFVTDHGDLHNVEHVTTPAPPSNSVVVANVAAFVAADFAERQFARPGFSITVGIAPFTHAVGDDPTAYTPFFPTNAWRLLLTPPPPAEPIVLTAFEERFMEFDDGIIGNAPDEGLRLFFPVAPEGFVDSFFDVTYDVEIFNDTPEPYLIMDFSQDTGPVAKGESEPGFFRITENLWIGENDMVFDGHDVVVDGCTVTVDGVHVFDRLALVNNATVTHSVGSMGLALTVLNDVSVGNGSRIHANGCGTGPHASTTGRSGGSHGGRGEPWGWASTSCPTYGSALWPVALGTGGKTDGGGSRGGGRIQIAADSLVLDGTVTANGQNGTDYIGGGSGGSVLLEVGTLSGSGSIEANGGLRGGSAGSGGGGRIAVYYDALSGFDRSRIRSAGQAAAGAGTLYLRDRSLPAGELILDNLNRTHDETLPTVLSGDFALVDRLTVCGQARLDLTATAPLDLAVMAITSATVTASFSEPGTNLFADAIALGGTARLQHGAGNANGLWISAGTLTVGADAALDAGGRGAGPSGATTGRSGGSHGGRGEPWGWASTSCPTYGSALWPVALGTGGKTDGGSSRGGGRIQIAADSIVLDGTVTANGQNGATYIGGGSGGSVLVEVGTLTGSGVIEANGGLRGASAGSGGGGRVAVYYDALSGFDRSRIRSAGQDAAGAGTLYLRDRSLPAGELILDNLNRTHDGARPSVLSGDFALVDRLTVCGQARLDLTATAPLDLAVMAITSATVTVSFSEPGTNIFADAIALGGTARLQHGAGNANGLRISAGTLSVGADAALDAVARGTGPTGPITGRSGGSYGGLGAAGTAQTNPTYGDALWPVHLGSGGKTDGGGSRGGGRIQIAAASIVLDGTVTANGENGPDYTGGGSGGSVLIEAGTLTGSGSIKADGGLPGAGAWAGGGGRVAVYAQDVSGFTSAAAQAKASSGAGWGTVFMGVPRTVAVTVTGQGACDPAGPTVIPYGANRLFTFTSEPVSLKTNGAAIVSVATFAWINNGLWRGTLGDAAWLASLQGGDTLEAGFEALAAGEASVQPAGGMAVTVNGLAGWRYTLERRESLTEGAWLPVPGQVEIVCPASGPLLLSDPVVLPQAFYRVVSKP